MRPLRKIILISVLALFSLGSVALAAPLTYNVATNIAIASPSTMLVIAAGSVADQLVINATSVVVAMSSSTGNSFTLTAAGSDLTISADAGGGSDPISCTNGVASTTISQSSGSTIYTITPTGTQCGQSSSPTPSMPTTVVNVPARYGPPNYVDTGPNTTTTPTSTIQSLQATIAMLEAQVQALLAQVAARSGSSSVLNTDLALWDSGPEVMALQQALVAINTGPAARALAARGTTKVFGRLTLKALEEFQAANHIPATGYFGPRTRAAILYFSKSSL